MAQITQSQESGDDRCFPADDRVRGGPARGGGWGFHVLTGLKTSLTGGRPYQACRKGVLDHGVAGL